MRELWLADNHEESGNRFFVTISKKVFVFATDDFYNTVFFFSQYRIPCVKRKESVQSGHY